MMTSENNTTQLLKKCIFCSIITENDPEKIVYQDESVVAFSDIRPASDHHYLIIPRFHLPNPKELDSTHKPLVEKLVKVAEELLLEKYQHNCNKRFGFHWPPFNTVSHLHLHAIAPVENMGFMSRLIFRQNSYWFVSPEYVLSRL